MTAFETTLRRAGAGRLWSRRARLSVGAPGAWLARLAARFARSTGPAGPDPDPVKARVRAAFHQELVRFLRSADRLAVPVSAAPRISVIVVVFNQAELTLQCLRGLQDSRDASFEVVVIDNGSTDETATLFQRVDGVRYIRNGDNLHFLRAVNQAASLARGDVLLLLNNDARARSGALRLALETLDQSPDIGVVGGKLILPDGRLQEAGSIVWNNGGCLGYGRGRAPEEPEFQFQRDVDFCSGAFALVRKDLFDRLGGLDARFAPAYYEEVDLCLGIQDAGFRVVYDPRVEVDHFEFGSSASVKAAIALQIRNRDAFLSKHAARLSRWHLPHASGPLAARMRPPSGGRVLFIDDQPPDPALGAGFPRGRTILESLRRAGAFVTFYPMTFPAVDLAAAYRKIPRDTEIAAGLGVAGLPGFLRDRAGYYDTVIVSRPHNMRFIKDALADVPDCLAGARLIYDAEAIFALREAARAELRGKPLTGAEIDARVADELALARHAHAVVSVSAREAAIFRAAGLADVRVLGHSLRPRPSPSAFGARAGVLFVGGVHPDEPNEDAVLWFVKDIMPRLDGLMGRGWRLTIAGACDSRRARALAGERVEFLGRVEDLSGLYDRARLFVAPTRFSAGIPHKAHEAAAFGLPVVATSALAAQLDWTDGEHLLHAADAEAFAAQCARLYADAELWGRIRAGALGRVAVDCDPRSFDASVADLLPPARASFDARRLATAAE